MMLWTGDRGNVNDVAIRGRGSYEGESIIEVPIVNIWYSKRKGRFHDIVLKQAEAAIHS